MNPERKLLTIGEYAQKIGRDRSAVSYKIKRGTLPAVKIGSRYFVYEDEPYEDMRVKTGDYAGWYDKYGKSQYEKRKEKESNSEENL